MPKLIIPGPAQPELARALELEPEATVPQMLAEIRRLKMAAAEGKNFNKPARRRRTEGKNEKNT